MTNGTLPLSSPNKKTIWSTKKKQANMTTPYGTNGTPCCELSGREGQETTLDKVAQLIANLQMIITQQSDIIKNLRAEVIEIKAEQQSFNGEAATIKAKLK
jgi:hypothetical protein